MTINVDELLTMASDPAKRHRGKADYWERVAAKARVDGDSWYEAEAKGKAAAERQKARMIEAEARP